MARSRQHAGRALVEARIHKLLAVAGLRPKTRTGNESNPSLPSILLICFGGNCWSTHMDEANFPTNKTVLVAIWNSS